MKNFCFFFILVVVVNGSENRDKRESLVSRFTGNSFFLRHFGGFSGYHHDHHEYEIHHPRVHLLTNSDEYTEDEETSSPNHVTSPIDNHQTIIIPVTEEPASNPEMEPIFKTLPLFEKTLIFRTENQPRPQTIIIPVTEEPKIEPIFKTLPQFEKTHIFRTENQPRPQENPSDEETVLYFFRSLPHFHRSILFRENNEKPEENSNAEVAYLFKSLPHFDVRQTFKEPTLFVSRVNGNEDTSEEGFKSLPHFSPADFRRGRKVRVVKRKRLVPVVEEASQFSDTGFQQELISVADLPLDNSVGFGNGFNSFGGLEPQ